MKEKTKNKSKEKTGSIGIFNAISKKEASFFEKQDNSWWWTFTLLLFLIGLATIWALTTFWPEFLNSFLEESNGKSAAIYSDWFRQDKHS